MLLFVVVGVWKLEVFINNTRVTRPNQDCYCILYVSYFCESEDGTLFFFFFFFFFLVCGMFDNKCFFNSCEQLNFFFFF